MQTDHVVCYVQVHGLNSNLPCLLNTVRKFSKCLSKKFPWKVFSQRLNEMNWHNFLVSILSKKYFDLQKSVTSEKYFCLKLVWLKNEQFCVQKFINLDFRASDFPKIEKLIILNGNLKFGALFGVSLTYSKNDFLQCVFSAFYHSDYYYWLGKSLATRGWIAFLLPSSHYMKIMQLSTPQNGRCVYVYSTVW